MFNKITGLELQVRTLFSAPGKPPDVQPTLSSVLDLTLDLKKLIEAFQQLLSTKEEQAAFDVNAALQRAEMLLRSTVRKERARIVMKLAPDLPPIAGKSVALQQVFLNLMLNAVQQMALKAEQFKWNGRRILEASTSTDRDKSSIQVRFTDTGPGIHRQLWEKIFTPGFSMRGGSGLGL